MYYFQDRKCDKYFRDPELLARVPPMFMMLGLTYLGNIITGQKEKYIIKGSRKKVIFIAAWPLRGGGG